MSYGDGLYKSTDGGKTLAAASGWRARGASRASRSIRAIPRHVVVGAFGDSVQRLGAIAAST